MQAELIVYMLVRLADIITTIIGTNMGIEELMPASSWLIGKGLFVPVNLMLSLILGYFALKISKTAFRVFIVINILVVMFNIWVILI